MKKSKNAPAPDFFSRTRAYGEQVLADNLREVETMLIVYGCDPDEIDAFKERQRRDQQALLDREIETLKQHTVAMLAAEED